MSTQIITLPRKPAEDWAATRAEWTAAVEQLAAEAETWAKEKQWLVHRDRKTITEDRIGSYEVPMLTIRVPAGPLILDPIARYIVGTSGRVDLCAFPSFDKVLIVRTDTGWHFVLDPPSLARPWSKEAFLQIAADWGKPSPPVRKAASMAKLRQAAMQLKQVSDPTRLQILMLLAERERNVGILCAELGNKSQPSVSHHLALLRSGRLIEPRREGKDNIYSLTAEGRKLAKIISSLAD